MWLRRTYLPDTGAWLQLRTVLTRESGYDVRTFLTAHHVDAGHVALVARADVAVTAPGATPAGRARGPRGGGTVCVRDARHSDHPRP